MIHAKQRQLPVSRKVAIGCALLFSALICLGGVLLIGRFTFKVERSQGAITITDVFLTTGLSPDGTPRERVSQFSPDTARIWCIVDVEAPKPVNVGVRWYYGDELIFDRMMLVERRGAWWIEPPPGQHFLEGEYRVEVYLVNTAERVVRFTVGEAGKP